jgi:putative DNA methylase
MNKMPVPNSVIAKVHTPLYTVHRYFARRPHNVFRHLIKHYLNDSGKLVLDPFAGGGVSVIEAVTSGHRAVGYEINDLAAFIIKNELHYIEADTIKYVFHDFIKRVHDRLCGVYSIANREIYWVQWISYTHCTTCDEITLLSPAMSKKSGIYQCQCCKKEFRPKLVSANSVNPTTFCSMTIGSSIEGQVKNPRLELDSEKILKTREKHIDKILAKSGLVLTDQQKTYIPPCNLRKESALDKKGINYFEDFFPKSSQGFILACISVLNEMNMKDSDRNAISYILSASLRYISRFSTLNESWRGDYKPLEWAKSNFWTPYAFVETNPFLAIWDRFNSYQRALLDLQTRFPSRKPSCGTVKSVIQKKADFAIVNHSSEKMTDLPAESIDLILTDPPYGSYVHYGELSGFWVSWLSKWHEFFKSAKIFKKGEAVPSRKKYENCKTFFDYEEILRRIFLECFRVLKKGGFMVMTFNNKEPEAWIALLRAVKSAGFYLPSDGVIFQDGVEVYKRTIDLRRDGAIHGDFIYSFQKCIKSNRIAKDFDFDWRLLTERILKVICSEQRPIKNSDLFVRINRDLVPSIFKMIDSKNLKSELSLEDITLSNLEKIVSKYLTRLNGHWIPNSHVSK